MAPSGADHNHPPGLSVRHLGFKLAAPTVLKIEGLKLGEQTQGSGLYRNSLSRPC